MKKSGIVRIALSIFLLGCAAGAAIAESYNEDAHFKSYVTKKDDESVVIAVNRDTNNVELYWSEKQNTWIKPDKVYKKELQSMYNKKTRLGNMQRELDRMRRDRPYENQQPLSQGRR